MSTITIGLAEIGVGAIAVDGGMGTTLAPLGYTEQDSCTWTVEEPEITDYIPEEIDDSIHSQEVPGAKTLTFTIMDPDVDTLEDITGGTVVVTGTAPNELHTFHAPATTPNIERSIKVTTKLGLNLEITRAKITYNMDSTFSKNGLFTITVKATVLKPTKALESSWRMYKPVAP